MRAALAALFALCALAAHAEPLGQRYEHRAAHDADGIGKFYLGREIAQVMGPGGILWLERTERETEEQPQLVIDALEIEPGQTIADLGAGSGYYSFRIAPLVGPAGKVLAIDIEPAMLDAIAQRARREHIGNVTTVRSSTQDPNLAPGSVDLLFMVDVYHELEYPYEMLTKVRMALKPRGRVALIEYRAEDPDVLIKPLHKMSERQVRREMQAAGFKHVKTVRTLPLQHLIVFEADR
ncbi:MAG TPA: methyltransferase domain-containing protein [Steroidobacteraceae bacterium]|jgi:ubiquinone/menaquinone biosynthesis C-methylase UbiE|nr:methyltransferase domain-containing protein [Steroidobacteraceae bacterium]